MTVAILPFLAAVGFGVLGQALPWLWLLVAFSGVGLSWAEGAVPLGAWEINVAGLQWGFTFLVGGLLLVLVPRSRQAWPTPFKVYALFVAVAVVGVLRSPNLFLAVRHTIQYAAPLVVGLVALRVAAAPERTMQLRAAYWVAFAIAAVVAIASLRWSTFTGHQAGLSGALGTRTFAIFLIPIYALALAGWRVRGPAYGLITAGVFALIVVTLSRTVTATALGLLGVTFLWNASWAARLRGLVLMVLVGVAAFSFDPLRERMFDPEAVRSGRLSEVTVSGEGREAALSLGGIALSGRGFLWLQTWRHALGAPVTGHGTGSSEHYLGNELQFATEHPHNDYLRVFHDAGVIGLAVMLTTAVVGLVSLRRLQLRSTTTLGQELSLAAFLTWLAYLLIAVTDNIFVYVSFFTQNLFLLMAIAYVVVEREARTASAPA